MPEFARASTLIAGHPILSDTVALGGVSSTTAGALADRLGVTTFPTFILFREGLPEKFPILTTAEAYVAGLAKLLGVDGVFSPAKVIGDESGGAELASWLFWRGSDNGKLATTLVLFSPPGAPASAELDACFEGAAEELFKDPSLRFARVTSERAMTDLEMDATKSTLVLYKEHDEGRVEYTGELTAAGAIAWVRREAVALVTLISHKTLQRYRNAVGTLALLFVEEAQTEHLPTLRRLYAAAHAAVYSLEADGELQRGNFTFGIANGKKYSSWMDHFGIQNARLPALTLEQTRKDGSLFTMPDVNGSWAAEAFCGPTAIALVGAAEKWTVELSATCPHAARVTAREKVMAMRADGTQEEGELELPPLEVEFADPSKYTPLVVAAVEFTDPLVEKMREWLREALKGTAVKVPVRVQTPFGEATGTMA